MPPSAPQEIPEPSCRRFASPSPQQHQLAPEYLRDCLERVRENELRVSAHSPRKSRTSSGGSVASKLDDDYSSSTIDDEEEELAAEGASLRGRLFPLDDI